MANVPTEVVTSSEIHDYLTSGSDWDLPDLDLNGDNFKLPQDLLDALKKGPTRLTDESLTTAKFDDDVREYGKVNGTGTFDKLLEAVKANLWVEWSNDRITGAEYATAYVSLVQATMQNSVSFLIQRDKAYWDALLAQTQAAIAAIDLETKKMQYLLSKFQAYLIRAQVASEKMKLGISDKQYGTMVLNDQLNTNKDTRETNVANKQIEVMTQQIASYKRKDERDLIKLQTDTWAVSKGIAEDTEVPAKLANPAIEVSMGRALANTGIG